MKYRDSDITLVKTDRIVNYSDFLPTENYMYLKIDNKEKIIFCIGDILKNVFRKTNSSIVDKRLPDINIEFFNDYILNMTSNVAEESSAYQFTFQHKDDMILYVCSVYPCFIYNECKSFDIIVRKNSKKRSVDKFFTPL